MVLAEKDVNSIVDRLLVKIRSIGGKNSEPASFSEDLQSRIEEAVKKANATLTASFNELLKERDTKIEQLQSQLNNHSTSTTRSEIVSFVEKLGPAKCPPAFRNMGLVEFMECLAGVDSKVTVISFEEKNGAKVEHKQESTPLAWFKAFLTGLGPFIEFGERFGNFSASGADPAGVVDPKEMEDLRKKAGLKAAEGGK